MKKLILTSASVAALAIAAPAVAQTNGSTVLQSGANQTATVAQDGANSESLVEQSNANNVANVQQKAATDLADSKVFQAGTDERASVIQASGAAQSRVQQSGGAQNASVFQDGSSSSVIEQSMRYNEASVSQTGDENTSVVLTSGVNGAVRDPDGNYGSADAAALVGVTPLGDGNGSVITQTARKSTRLNSSPQCASRMTSSAC